MPSHTRGFDSGADEVEEPCGGFAKWGAIINDINEDVCVDVDHRKSYFLTKYS